MERGGVDPQALREGGSARRGRAGTWLAVIVAIAATVLAVATLFAAAFDDMPVPFEAKLPPWLLLGALVGVATMVGAAWLVAVERPLVTIGLAIAVVGMAIPDWAARSWLFPGAQAAAVAAGAVAVSGVLLIAAGWTRQPRGLLSVVPHVLVAGAVVVHLVGYDPFDEPSCVLTCERVTAPLAAVLSSRTAVTVAGVLVIVAAIVGIVREVRVTRGHGALPLGLIIGFVVLGAGWAIRLARWDANQSAILTATPVILASVTVGVTALAAAWRVRRTRSAVERVVAGLGSVGASDGRGTIRQVQYAIPDMGLWVDEGGREVHDPEPGESLVIADGDRPSIRLVVDPRVDRDDLVAALTPAARLALQNAQLAAVARARLAEVQASRRRVIAVSDAERARIERDLHDGAQQRLVAATFHLNVARNRGLNEDVDMGRADELVKGALANLRRLSHGIFPASLTTGGLRSALEELAGGSEVGVSLEVADVELPADVAFAAYAMGAAAVEAASVAGSRSVAVHVARDMDEVIVDVEVSGGTIAEDAFVDVADRFAALEGTLSTAQRDGITKLMGRLPCGSS